MPQSFQNPTELEPVPDLDSDRVQPGTDRVIEETPTTNINQAFESEGANHGLDDDNNNDFSEFDEEGEDEFDDDDDEFNESD